MIIGASPMVAALQSAQQLRQRTSSSKRASDPVAPTTSKKAKRIPDADPDEGVVTTNANVFRWLDRAQLAHFGLHDTIKALTKDSELLKSSMATHAKEVKGLKAEVAKLNASLTEERESIKKLAEDMKLAREDALEKFKELEAFHEEPRTRPSLRLNAAFLIGCSTLIANLDSVAGMDSTPVPTLGEDDQGDTVALEEEDPSAALQFNRRRFGSSERNPPTELVEGETVEVPQSEA
nr:hypothetical protein Iba_scaffold9224CG0080 [Ipomoea batatas]